ncbi:S66 peptidase family protein [Rhodothermus profundi]|uniref:Muramoyltetrapeptide carboxypeptidase n=1 Tax=Rhodothermus profundi TaxID=633813 RepID=A0A1M6PEJ3_9BACT|nr:LD-carboxypeptidase [Rhodothermus profundi]SHK06363.1 muramoyltetrapeptide carboxypeptidase [Rhodothermus profundi]
MAVVRHYPPPLRPGDRVAVIAPASPPDPEKLEAGIRRLEAAGLTVERGQTLALQRGYLAGDDQMRAKELNHYLQRTDIRAIFCARGGYGCLRLLPLLDYEAATRTPKLLIGYSDITALHLALLRRAHVPGLSGPMVATDWPLLDRETEQRFWEMAQGAAPHPLSFVGNASPHVLRPGEAEGLLIGGTLSVLVRLIGTPYLPDLNGAILFLEDVGEAPYRIDGMLAQLHLAGVLDRLAGLILGYFTECAPAASAPSLTLQDVLHDYLGRASYPVVTDFPYGHVLSKNTLPIGVRARLIAGEAGVQLSLLEPVVRAAGLSPESFP